MLRGVDTRTHAALDAFCSRREDRATDAVTEWQVDLDVSDCDRVEGAIGDAVLRRSISGADGPAWAEPSDASVRSSLQPWATRAERHVSDVDRRGSGR